ncbi:MAG TPA: hypothetical protein VGO80_20520 [Solirubrobacteraceae bacterium]|jgi:hypothetical protein|nr:hypothetical protein [Solirubrobacteraceae bacterium]
MALLVASSAGTGVGMALGGIAAVLVISAVFYAIGRGEDRDRAAAARAAAAPDEPDEARETPPPAGSRLPARTPRRRRR